MSRSVKTLLSKWFFYIPATLARFEPVVFLLPIYNRRQKWTKNQLIEWQEKKLKLLLKHAQSKSLYYKNSLPNNSILNQEGTNFFESYSKLPTITKRDLIGNEDKIKTGKRLFISEKVTGGSTGEPVKLAKDSYALACERAATWRSYEWAGIGIGEKQARFWGVPHSTSKMLTAKLTDFISRRKRFSAFDMGNDKLGSIYKELQKYKPAYIYGYVSAIDSLSQYAIEHQLESIPSLKCVITTSEVLSEIARKNIEKAFKVKVYNEYGCGEVGSIAHECSHGSLHIMSDNLYIETEGDELIITDLTNFAMPLIRYKVGDLGCLTFKDCKCGSNFPILEKISGRAYDIITTPEGKSIHPEALIYVFEDLQKEERYFNQFQVIQTHADQFTVNIMPARQLTNLEITKLELALKKNISSTSLFNIKVVEQILREKSGKMRVVKCSIEGSAI